MKTNWDCSVYPVNSDCTRRSATETWYTKILTTSDSLTTSVVVIRTSSYTYDFCQTVEAYAQCDFRPRHRSDGHYHPPANHTLAVMDYWKLDTALTQPSGRSIQPLDALPWPWILTAQSTDKSCPRPSELLGMFAIVNVIGAAASIVFSYRPFIRAITCGVLGTGSGRLAMFLPPFLLHLVANAIIAVLLTRDDQYQGLFTARPRMACVVIMPLQKYFVRPAGSTSGNPNVK